MKPYIAVAVLAAVLVLIPAVAGYAPALAQDFSITNQNDVQVEGAVLGTDWIKKLQAWWDVHAYYPKEAAAKNESGNVKLHLVIHPDGKVWLIKPVEGSGSKSIDQAVFWTFHNMFLQPFPPGTPAPQADVTITLHYVLSDQPARKPFTITNAPVKNSVVATMLQRTCAGTVLIGGWGPNRWGASQDNVRVIFYHKPDGAAWIDFWPGGHFGLVQRPVTELGVSAQWNDMPRNYGQGLIVVPHYAVWPAGENHLSGTVTDVGPRAFDGEASIELSCDTTTVPQIQRNPLAEVP